jgi:hypothetical protein
VPEPTNRWAGVCAGMLVWSLLSPLVASAFRAPELTPQQEKLLRDNWALCKSKKKGPYTENYCLCGGKKLPVMVGTRISQPCGNPTFCAAYRAPWAEAIGAQRMWIANVFARDLYIWDTFPDHNDLVRGYVLEKYFIETNPQSKLAEMRAYGGLSGAEYEAPAQPLFFERYLSAPEFDPARHYLLAYELQRRFYVRAELGQIVKVREMAIRVQQADSKFKPLRDAVHNQLSAGLIAPLATYRDRATGSIRKQVDEIILEIVKLTSLDETALAGLIASLQDEKVRAKVQSLMPDAKDDPVDEIRGLADIMVYARDTVTARAVPPAEQRRLIDLAIGAAQVIQSRGSKLLEDGKGLDVVQTLRLLGALTDGGYGAGLLNARERQSAEDAIDKLEAMTAPTRDEFTRTLVRAERVVEWAQGNVELAFAEVLAPWTFLVPQVATIRDDVLRSSPLLLYATVSGRLDQFAAGSRRVTHDLFGTSVESGVRALNPGLALGTLRVDPAHDAYTRDEVVALRETPADLDPASGILTQGEGNVLSHVQLLARALGIPNVVVDGAAYRRIVPNDGKQAFLVVTPGGRVILKDAAAMTAADKAVYAEYTRNQARSGSGELEGRGPKLHIDRAKIDLSKNMPIDLTQVRRADSGRFCGPKAAFLGELKHVFPDRVARGIVVPFGAYYDHYRAAKVVVPDGLKATPDLASDGEPLPGFVERTYKEFFDVLVPKKTSEKALAAWIQPRLEIVRHSIRQSPLSPELREAVRKGLTDAGLMTNADQTVGCFVRSDTNVEDLDNFNGAGLNLTVFNRKSLDDIYDGLRQVWASPFEFRSFSWRQTLIDDPLWVLSSVVILEAVPSEKSGVLVTADPNGKPGAMLVATSEGVGGAVDGTSAETLLWSPDDVEIITLFKSPYRNALLPGGGSGIVPSTGRDTVLEPKELSALVDAGKTIQRTFAPVLGASGNPKPWDIEFGFAAGKLWLFQCRPFLGNDQLKNLPALAPLDGATVASGNETLNMKEILR